MKNIEAPLLELSGSVSTILFANEENGYSVFKLDVDSGKQETVTGHFPLLAPGESLVLHGRRTRHPVYGDQFNCEYCERFLPTDSESIYSYLAGGAVKGIGPATAALMVATFGKDTLQVLRAQPEKLAALKGIGPKKATEFSQRFKQQAALRSLMDYLVGAELSPIYAIRLYRVYGDDAEERMKENPYILARDNIGAGFLAADKLAASIGIDSDAPERIEAAIVFELKHNADNGHCFIPGDKLIGATAEMISVEEALVEDCLATLVDAGDIVMDTVSGLQACYLARLYEDEVYIADRLKSMTKDAPSDTVSLERVIERLEAEQKILLSDTQKEALKAASSSRVSIITGGPGTGKTTSLLAVLALYDAMKLDVCLAAPTGRAAKRMTELTGREAGTVHKLLEAAFSADTAEVLFRKDEDDPLACQALILDECSMIDVSLMHAVLRALPDGCRLVLVGDADQLPSVGPGNLFRDLIRSQRIPVVRLTEVFRQAETSRIISNAHKINRGICPDFKETGNGFYFMTRRDAAEAAATIVELCSTRLPVNMNIPSDEIQVLTPTRKGDCGTANLNKLLQKALNPPAENKHEVHLAERILREGDRVMQIRNDYDIMWRTSDQQKGTGIFNGDTGYILSVDSSSEVVTVDFDGKIAAYAFDMLGELEHAWAITVHKAQGSEYRAVVLSVSRPAQPLMYRSLLYTAVTRAAELLVVVGERDTVRLMTENNRRARRYSALRSRLCDEA